MKDEPMVLVTAEEARMVKAFKVSPATNDLLGQANFGCGWNAGRQDLREDLLRQSSKKKTKRTQR